MELAIVRDLVFGRWSLLGRFVRRRRRPAKTKDLFEAIVVVLGIEIV